MFCMVIFCVLIVIMMNDDSYKGFSSRRQMALLFSHTVIKSVTNCSMFYKLNIICVISDVTRKVVTEVITLANKIFFYRDSYVLTFISESD